MNTFRCFPHSLDTLVFVKQCVQYEMQTFQNAIFKMLFRKRLLLVCFIVFSPRLNLYQNERVISNASGSWNECFSRKFHLVLPIVVFDLCNTCNAQQEPATLFTLTRCHNPIIHKCLRTFLAQIHN